MVGNQRLMNSETGLKTLRRQFLLDMTWPVASDLLCQMFGLINTSPEVRQAEQKMSDERMRRLAEDDLTTNLVINAAKDASTVLGMVHDPEERAAWLVTYAMAVVNLLEQQGKLVIVAA